MKTSSHPGFRAVAQSIALREHLPLGRAGAILASRTRKASRGAKARNPRLANVRGGGGY